MAWSDVLLQQSMSRTGCSGAPLDTFKQRVGMVSDDVEMAYVAGLVGKQCRVDMTLPPPPPPQPAVAWKVKVDSDVPIAEVTLACANGTQRDMLTGSDTVASFQAWPGACSLTLMGAVPMTVPPRCRIEPTDPQSKREIRSPPSTSPCSPSYTA